MISILKNIFILNLLKIAKLNLIKISYKDTQSLAQCLITSSFKDQLLMLTLVVALAGLALSLSKYSCKNWINSVWSLK
jgi:hypothetical protein